MGGSKVGACALGEPTDGTDDALILLLPIEERLGRFVLVRFRTGVYRETGAIRSSIVGHITKMNVV